MNEDDSWDSWNNYFLDLKKDDLPEFLYDGFRLKQTCGACPEQYDVFDKLNNYVGYLRLRHGSFTVDNAYGKTIFLGHPKGDGIFDADERDEWLTKAVMLLKHDRELEND